MRKTIIGFFMITLLNSCESQKLDLSKIDFEKNSTEYNLENIKFSNNHLQKGHYEIRNASLKLIDNGEKINNYSFSGSNTDNIHYNYLKIDPVLGATISDYNNKISYISLSVINSQTLELINYLKKQNGNPVKIINNERLQEMIDKNASNMLLKGFPNSVKIFKNDLGNEMISYPQNIVWIKNNVIYQLVLEPVNNNVGNVLKIITIKALKDKVIFGYHMPEKDPILSNIF